MDEDERREDAEEMNEENDAREEDIVEDTDADTRDVEENEDENDGELMRRLDRLEEMVGRVIGGLDALRDAQSVMVDNGATIIDDGDEEEMDFGIDDFVEPEELDLTL